jgi:hypothetical protein
MTENERREEEILEQLPELETVCPECRGEHDYNGNPCGPWEPCGSCNGIRYLPTVFGEKVLRLVRHNFGRSLKRLQHGE